MALAAVDPTPGTAPPPEARRTKVAVIELSGVGINDITRNLEQYLRNSIATIDGYQVVSSVDLQMALQEPKGRAIAHCGGGPDCARQMGQLVDADIVIIGSISALGDNFSLNLRALEVKKKKERARYHADVAGRDKLIPEVRLAAYRLVAPEKIRGWLMVEISVDGVEIAVDGAPVGVTPLTKPIENLTPGTHTVEVKRAGYQPFRQEFVIRPFEPTRLRISLDQHAAAPGAP
jgi:hypothetical protein